MKLNENNKKVINKIFLVVCILLIVSGIFVSFFPFFAKMYVQKKQDNLMDEIQALMEENAEKRANGEIIENMNSSGSGGQDNNMEDKNINDFSNESNSVEAVDSQIDNIDFEQNDNDKYKISNEDLLSTQNVIGIIEINKLDIKFPIVEGTGRWNIAYAIGHMIGTASIGESGNCLLAGHRGGIYGEFFKNIHKLEKGDEVVLKNIYGDKFVYEVYESSVIEPDDMWIVEPVEDYDSIVTLLSCENHGKQRIVVRAKLKK